MGAGDRLCFAERQKNQSCSEHGSAGYVKELNPYMLRSPPLATARLAPAEDLFLGGGKHTRCTSSNYLFIFLTTSSPLPATNHRGREDKSSPRAEFAVGTRALPRSAAGALQAYESGHPAGFT